LIIALYDGNVVETVVAPFFAAFGVYFVRNLSWWFEYLRLCGGLFWARAGRGVVAGRGSGGWQGLGGGGRGTELVAD